MSFRCEACKTARPVKERSVQLVVRTTNFTHPARYNANGDCIDNGGKGTQIVREKRVCKNCAVPK